MEEIDDSISNERQALLLAEQAFALPPEHRGELLASADVSEQVQRRAMALVQAEDGPSATAFQSSWRAGVPEVQPELAGAYRIIERIGAGGMGSVYRAERSDGAFDRQVAIKVLHTQNLLPDQQELDAFAARFERERQILANLQHPNIAQMLDGGYLEDGTPYLVMELIDGTRIDDYVQQHSLNVPETLSIFIDLCDAVQAAHQNLVVHRDIKPANILVNQQGQPKLLDFGIAKSLSPTDTELTRTNTPSAMTLDYASPEQLRGQPATSSTDVYGLGALLYQLLSGTKPFDHAGLTYGEIEARIIEHDPKPLREAANAKRRAQLSTDLELIVQSAMAKEPARRYATAAALKDEIERYLQGVPIAARGDSTLYRTGKLLKRHWLGFSTAAAVAAAVLIALVVSLTQTSIARTAALRAEATSEFLSKILLSPSSRADSPLGLGSDAKISALLNAAEAELTGPSGELAFRDANNARTEMMVTLARTYHGLAMYEQAQSLLTEAQGLCTTPACAQSETGYRIAFHSGQALVMLGEPERALLSLSEVEQEVAKEQDLGLLLADILNEKASALWSVGRPEDTVKTMERAVALYQQHSPDPALVGVAFTRLGSLYSNLGRLSEGLETLQRAAEIYESSATRALPEMADLYNEIGIIHWKRGDREAFKTQLLKAWEVVQAIDGVSEIEIRILTNLGGEYVDQDEGRYWLEKSRAAVDEFASEQHETRAWVDLLEGRILAHEAQYAAAIAVFEKALATFYALMPAYNDAHAGAEMAIGSTYSKLKQHEDALPYNQRVYEYFRKIYSSEETEYLRDARDRLNVDLAALNRPLVAEAAQ